MLVVIDHHDSFVHNLARYVKRHGLGVRVFRYGTVTVEAVAAMQPSHLILSPGPGAPDDVPESVAMVQAFAGALPILGVCLGQQIIAQAFGGRIVRAKRPLHGMATAMHHDGSGLFTKLPSPFAAGRYHSLVASPEALPACLRVTARSDEGEIMALAHCSWPVFGLQFHPESVLTEVGDALVASFLQYAEAGHAHPG